MLPRKNVYYIVKEKRLVIERHQGELTIPELIDFKIALAKDPHFSPEYNQITDMRYVEFKVNNVDIDKYVRFLRVHPEVAGKRKLAILTDTPMQTAFSTLFKHEQYKLNQIVEIFASVESAIGWLHLDQFTAADFEAIPGKVVSIEYLVDRER